jgi:hypothetical protein
MEAARERHGQLRVNATPSFGRHEPVPVIAPLDAWRLSLLARRPTAIGVAGGEVRATMALDAWRTEPRLIADTSLVLRSAPRDGWFLRPSLDVDWQRALAPTRRLVLRTIAGAVIGRDAPEQLGIRFGGAATLPGVPFHALRGTWGLSQRVEWQQRVPAPSIPLGRYGRTAANAVVAPYAVLGVVGDGDRTARAEPVIGIALLSIFDVLRIDLATPLRGDRPRTVMFQIDVTRDFWRIL